MDANEAFEETFGYSRQEIVGKTSVELGLTTPETRASIMEKVQQGLLPGYEWQMRTKSGEVRVVLINSGVVTFGGQKHVVTTFQDITERKQAEEQRARLTERLELATRVAEMGIWDWDIPSNRLVWDEQMYALYGRQRHEFAGAYEAWLQGVHPADRAASNAASARARRGESDYNTEFRVVWSDGSIHWLHATGQVFFDAAGQAVRMIGVNYNITARKQAEEKLRQSEAQLNTIFEASPIAIGLSRLSDGQITHINTAFENLYGYARAEIVGRTTAELNIWEAPADRQRFIELLKAEGACMLETIARLKSGDNRHVLVSGRVVTINGEPYAMAQIVDISQRKHMEDELRRSNAELEQFAYVASHDLQEPLRAVAGMMQLLQQRYHGRLDEYADEYIELAVEAANRMQALINDLLTYSRVGRRGKSFEPVNAGSCLETALQNLKVAIAESQAVIAYDNLPTVTADATQLVQLFQNLIGNSLKFRSDQPPQIHISAVKTAARWQFSVRDNGIGIEPQYFERIFQVFQRLHTRDEYPGTGIGLALCQKIVERHNGAIWVESQGGQGSTFYFTLPLRNTINDNP